MSDVVKLSELKAYEENPFLDGLGRNTRNKTEILYNGSQAIVNLETGEVEDQIAIARVRLVEKDQFVKLYLANMHVFFDLGKAAQRVCEFLLHIVGTRAIGRGEVLLAFTEYEKYYAGRQGGTRATWLRGLQELAAKNLIARSQTKSVWYINPAVIFNGDRARFITEIRRKKTQAEILESRGQTTLDLSPEEEVS